MPPVGVLVQPGQAEHVIDEGAHPLGLQRDPAHRLIDLMAPPERALLVQLRVGTHGGKRVPELVAGVSEKPPGEALMKAPSRRRSTSPADCASPSACPRQGRRRPLPGQYSH